MKRDYKTVKDETYGYWRVDPIPSEEVVSAYYAKEFYASSTPKMNDSSLEVQKQEEEFFNSRWETIVDHCDLYFGNLKNRTVFDIGFGYAQLLLYLRNNGMNVSGLEPSPEGVAYAREQGLNVFQAGIEDFSCTGGNRYDLITLLNVLEHLRSPADTLCDIRNHLMKQDSLLVIDVPNDFNELQLIADKEYGLNEWWVAPPGHINYFSPDSLVHLLDICGYKIVHMEASFPLEMFLLMGDVYVGNNELGKKCHEKRVHFEMLLRKHGKKELLTRFYTALAELGIGRQILVFATLK